MRYWFPDRGTGTKILTLFYFDLKHETIPSDEVIRRVKMKLLKYITAFIWLTALLLPLVTPLVLQVQQRFVQWEMLEALEKKELITITAAASTIHWVKKEKECMINGEMFDVKRMEQQGDKLILTGLYDEKEKQIKKQLLTQTKEQQKDKRSSQVVKLILQTALVNKTEIFDYKQAELPVTYISVYRNSYYQSPFKGTATPPPRLS